VRLVGYLKRKQINTLILGFNYAIEKDPKHYISELIIDTQNAINYLDAEIQNTFRYPATRKIKQIIQSNTHKTHYTKRSVCNNYIYIYIYIYEFVGANKQ
jgi:hypothetical protein